MATLLQRYTSDFQNFDSTYFSLLFKSGFAHFRFRFCKNDLSDSNDLDFFLLHLQDFQS